MAASTAQAAAIYQQLDTWENEVIELMQQLSGSEAAVFLDTFSYIVIDGVVRHDVSMYSARIRRLEQFIHRWHDINRMR